MRTLLVLTILGSSLYAQESRFCSNATVKGTYGYTVNGTRPAGLVPGAPLEQVMTVGVRNYDGQGNFTQIDTTKASMTAPTIDQRASGTYTINPDCTGTAIITINGAPGPEARFVVVNRGKEIHWIVLSPPFVMAAGGAVLQ